MLQREALGGPIQPPTWRRFETAEGLPIWLCSATGVSTYDLASIWLSVNIEVHPVLPIPQMPPASLLMTFEMLQET